MTSRRGGGGRRGRAWDSFGLSRVAIIINSLFLTNDRVFALPRIKGPGFAGRRMRLIFLTGAGGRAQSAARFPLRCLNGDPANRVPDVSMDGANHPRSLARLHYVRTYRSEPSYRCHWVFAWTWSDNFIRLSFIPPFVASRHVSH